MTTPNRLSGGAVSAGAYFDAAGHELVAAAPVKASGAEIDTGTNDTKFATPKAIADSKLVSGGTTSVDGAIAVYSGTGGQTLKAVAPAVIADLAIAAVTGVDGTANNAASKADVDTAFAAIVAKLNDILDALEAIKVTSLV